MYNDLDQQRHILIKKLLYKSKNRGCKETDLIIGKFAKEFLNIMNIEDLIKFAEILEQNDADIYDWYINKTTLPPALDSAIMRKFLKFDIESTTKNSKRLSE